MADQPLDPPAVGPSTALARAMVDDGVDLADEHAVTAWIDHFNRRSFDERAQVLAGQRLLISPVALPDDEELTAAVRRAPIFAQMAAFLAWVGERRRLTEQGRLALAEGRHLAGLLGTAHHGDRAIRGRVCKDGTATDVRDVDLVLRLAEASRLVRRHEGAVVRTRRGSALLEPARSSDTAPEIWRDLVTALLDAGAVSGGDIDEAELAWWETCLDQRVTELLCTFVVTGTGLWVDGVASAAIDRILAAHDVSGLPQVHRVLLPESISYSIMHLFDRLVAFGLVWCEDRLLPTDSSVGGHAVGVWAELTPLGNWFVRPLLIARGFEVPVLGQHAAGSADDLLDAIAGWQPRAFAVEVRMWASARAEPVDELIAAAVSAPTLERRTLVFEALDVLGDAAIPAVRTAVALPVLRPFAIGWLMEYDVEPEGALDVTDDPRTFVETLAVILVTLGPDAMCSMQRGHGSGEAELATIEGLWRVNDPYVGPVLEALSRHAVEPVAKAARRALFKLRNFS